MSDNCAPCFNIIYFALILRRFESYVNLILFKKLFTNLTEGIRYSQMSMLGIRFVKET